MLQISLVKHLRRSGIARVVKSPEPSGRTGCTVFAHIRRFERVVSAEAAALAVIEIDIEVKMRGQPTPILAQEYAKKVPTTDPNMAGTVLAFSAGVREIFNEFIIDLAHNSSHC